MTNVWRVPSLSLSTHVNTGNILMWETQHKKSDEDCSMTLILQETLKTQVNIRWNSVLFRKSNICANKLDVQETSASTVLRKLKYFLMQV